MVEIKSIDENTKTVVFDNGDKIDYPGFMKKFIGFWQNRIAGETLSHLDMENFMKRTSGKTMSSLIRGKKLEGYMEGSSDKMLTTGQKIAIGTALSIVIVVVVVYVILKGQGLVP